MVETRHEESLVGNLCHEMSLRWLLACGSSHGQGVRGGTWRVRGSFVVTE